MAEQIDNIALGSDQRERLAEIGAPMPATGGRFRVAFVGQRTYFESSALNHATDSIEPMYFDFRADADAGALVSELNGFEPHVVIVFRPEIIPSGLLRELPALKIGFLTEPLPRAVKGNHHPDLKRRLEYLGQVDETNFDRIVSFDPLVVESAGKHLGIWRSVPLPVADEYFRPVEPWSSAPRPTFMGRSTRHREAWLVDAKHYEDVLHIAHGLHGKELLEFLDQPMLSINLHNEKYPSFEVRVPLCLASGHLVATERLSPLHGLEPDIDHLEMLAPANLLSIIHQVKAAPNVYHQTRLLGRMKAEAFRASRVFPRLIGDLYEDVAAFGRSAQR